MLQAKDNEVDVLQHALKAQAGENTREVAQMWNAVAALLGTIRTLQVSHGRGGAGSGSAAPTGSDVEKRMPFDPATPDELEDLRQRAITHKVVQRWKRVARERKEARNTWILLHSWGWMQRARDTIRRRNELLSLLRSTKASGVPLSVAEENVLRDPTLMDMHEAEFECGICIVEYPMDEILVLTCGHRACVDCSKWRRHALQRVPVPSPMCGAVKDHCIAGINSGKAVSLDCVTAGCEEKLTFDDIRNALRSTPEQFERYQGFLLESHLDHDPLMARCPKPRCQTPMLRRSETDHMCVCPKCNYSFCDKCEVEWHSDSTCAQYQQWKRENSAGDSLYEKWRQRHTKACPGCSKPIQKNGGCNHMSCRCGKQFCWLCMVRGCCCGDVLRCR